MIEPTVRQILPGTDMVGESIVWDLERGCMFWVDIVGRAIRRFDPVSGHEQRWEAPELPTSIGLRTDGGAIVGLTRRVALWDFGETFETLAIPEPDLPDNRLNEGKVAPDGSFWVGTMQNKNRERDIQRHHRQGRPLLPRRRLGRDNTVVARSLRHYQRHGVAAWKTEPTLARADFLVEQRDSRAPFGRSHTRPRMDRCRRGHHPRAVRR
jgi:sugar lactone lactonase YvrE